MFEVGFTEIIVISVLALVVLGPEKLPRVAAQIGKWIGRARAMARQFREQLEDEVQLAETNKNKAKEAERAEQDAAAAQSGTAASSMPGADASTAGSDAPTPASTQNMYSGVTGEQEGHAADTAASTPDAAAETAHSDANGPAPEPEATVYQPPKYAHAGAEETYGAAPHAETNGAAATEASPSQPAPVTTPHSHDDDPPLKPGDFITHTHERGI
jgi:sec-independent protein translocase protein TatB